MSFLHHPRAFTVSGWRPAEIRASPGNDEPSTRHTGRATGDTCGAEPQPALNERDAEAAGCENSAPGETPPGLSRAVKRRPAPRAPLTPVRVEAGAPIFNL